MSVFRRLTHFTRQEIRQLFKTVYRVVTHPGLTILRAPKVNTCGRILIITPAKIGAAPKRNRVRRRLKAIFYEHQLYNEPFDVIVIVKKDGLLLSFSQLKDLLFNAIYAPKPTTKK